MKTLLKLTMVGAALVAASSAYADVLPPSSGNGELMLFVRKEVSAGSFVTYARGLNINLNSVLSPAVTDVTDTSWTGPVQAFNYSLPVGGIGPDSNLSSFLQGASNVTWTVMAADTDTDFFTPGSLRFLTTTPINLASNPTPDNGVLGGFWTNIDGMVSNLNNVLPGAAGSGDSITVGGQWGATGGSYANATNWFGAGFNNTNLLGSAANLYVIVNSSDDSLALGHAYQAGFGLQLLADGTLVTPGGTEVPLPAGLWLLGSGLVGLAGIGRRRKAAAAAVAA